MFSVSSCGQQTKKHPIFEMANSVEDDSKKDVKGGKGKGGGGGGGGGGGWWSMGGIISSIIPKKKNQVHLPDDSSPSVSKT